MRHVLHYQRLFLAVSARTEVWMDMYRKGQLQLS